MVSFGENWSSMPSCNECCQSFSLSFSNAQFVLFSAGVPITSDGLESPAILLKLAELSGSTGDSFEPVDPYSPEVDYWVKKRRIVLLCWVAWRTGRHNSEYRWVCVCFTNSSWSQIGSPACALLVLFCYPLRESIFNRILLRKRSRHTQRLC